MPTPGIRTSLNSVAQSYIALRLSEKSDTAQSEMIYVDLYKNI